MKHLFTLFVAIFFVASGCNSAPVNPAGAVEKQQSAALDSPMAEKSKWQRYFPGLSIGVVAPREWKATPREHIHKITAQKADYSISMAGTLDGPSTRSPRGYAAWAQVFQPMKFVRLENVGETDVVNPRLVVNGKRQWWTAQDFVDSALRAYGNPANDADKVRAIYEYYVNHRFHGSSASNENDDPIKALNIFGYTLCNNDGRILQDFYRTAGFKVRNGRVAGHVVMEVFHDGRWHVIDADQSMIFLRRDNKTLASNNDIARDHDLVKRTHSYSINFPADRRRDEAAAYAYYGENTGDGQLASNISHTMDMTLRPGEALEWRFARRQDTYRPEIRRPKIYSHGPDIGSTQGRAAGALVYNGKWIYNPPLRDKSSRRIHSEQNTIWSENANEPALRPAKAGQEAVAVWKISSPYVIVGGTIRSQMRLNDGDNSELAVSFDDGATWNPVEKWEAVKDSPGTMEGDLDLLFPEQPAKGPRHEAARYSYLLRLKMSAKGDPAVVGLESLSVENDLQMAPLSLPELEFGNNGITYSDASPGARQVQVTFNWQESSVTRPPAAPATPIAPRHEAQVEGTQVVFEWAPAVDPDGDTVVDYHFQLSDRPDMLWPLSPNFHMLSSNTKDRELNRYTSPYTGLLNPGERYYWRVRALDDKGVWSPWSKIWSFVANASGVPMNVTATPDNGGALTLTWEKNTNGRAPVKYEIYGSNMPGFTASHEPYSVYLGDQKIKGVPTGVMDFTFEPNLLRSVTTNSVSIRPEHAHYRIVAVDEKGNRSGASDFVSVPRLSPTPNAS